MYKANAVYIVTGREWMIFMKNRDNEFFDQQKLDELVKNRDLDRSNGTHFGMSMLLERI